MKIVTRNRLIVFLSSSMLAMLPGLVQAVARYKGIYFPTRYNILGMAILYVARPWSLVAAFSLPRYLMWLGIYLGFGVNITILYSIGNSLCRKVSLRDKRFILYGFLTAIAGLFVGLVSAVVLYGHAIGPVIDGIALIMILPVPALFIAYGVVKSLRNQESEKHQ